jgi:lysophospholipase L1-like esterase
MQIIFIRPFQLVFLLLLASGFELLAQDQIKVACVGNSITYGSGIENREQNSYPAQLQSMLGDKWIVKNFGKSGATLLKKGDKPYWDQPEYQSALGFQPDVVIIKLGTNDSKPQNWQYHESFFEEYSALINNFQELESKPRVLICLPVPAYEEKWGIRESIIKEELLPMTRKVARKNKTGLIDLYKPLSGKENLFPDKIHPDASGARIMAEVITGYLMKNEKKLTSKKAR